MAASAAARRISGTTLGLENLVLTHMVSAVNRAQASDEPYSHVYIENVFPQDFYERICTSLPDTTLYSPQNIKVWVRPDGTSTRDRLFVTSDAISNIDEDRRELWRTVSSLLTSAALKKAVFRRVAKDLAFRFAIDETEVDGIQSHPRLVLLRDTDQYRIKPHPDGLETIVTMQFYFPENDHQEQLGTSLYRQRPLWERTLGKGKFEEVKRFPFRPNSAYAFVVNNRRGKRSWHGVERVPSGIGVRNTLLNRYMASATDAAY